MFLMFILLPHGGAPKNIPQFICLGVQQGGKEINGTAAALLGVVKGKKSYCCVRSTFLSPRRHMCWHHHRPLDQKIESAVSFSAGTWTDRCPARALIISVLWRSRTPCQKKNDSDEVENSDDVFLCPEIRKKYGTKSYKNHLVISIFFQK